MGKGGPLAFLNKKTWHPGRVQNLEEVWKREQAAAKEEQKARDLQKQIVEERAREELRAVAEAAGVRPKSDRIDWMYQGGVAARQEADQRQQAQAEDVAVALDATAAADAAATAAAAAAAAKPGPAGARAEVRLPAFYAEDTPASANELWQRLHADPLFAIRQQEVAARRSIASNPVQMQAIKAQVRELKQLAGKGDKKHKKDKKKKKEKKEHRRRHRSRSSSPGPAGKRARSAAAPQQQRPPPQPPAAGEARPAERIREPRPGEHSWRDDRGRELERRGGLDTGCEGDRGEGGRPHGGDREGGRDARRRSRDRAASATARDAAPAAVPRDAPAAGEAAAGAADDVRVHRDAASAQGLDARYGITFAGHVPDELKHADRSEAAEATRRRLEAAAIKKEQELKDQAAQRYQRREHRTGQLSSGDKARRLAEMTAAAEAHEGQRRGRVQQADAKEQGEEAERAERQAGSAAAFLAAASKEVYGTAAGGSLEDTVGRRKFFNERRDGAAAAFRRGS